MRYRTRLPAFFLLVALALSVAAPPVLLALERPPDSVIAPGSEAGQVPSSPRMVSDNGDPDDWASRSDQSSSGGREVSSDESDVSWRDYLDSLRGLLGGIKLQLAGIL
jgi:hypothetical protein